MVSKMENVPPTSMRSNRWSRCAFLFQESELGVRCSGVGAQFNPTGRSLSERPIGYIGNVKVVILFSIQ